jgi:CRISPR-associated endoribonuclease Cas6
MRTKIPIYTEKIPIIFRHRVIALIKEALSKSNRDYFEALYNSKKPKPFTFNLTFDGSQTVEEEFYLDSVSKIKDKVFYQNINNPAFLYISSDDYEFFANVLNGIREIKAFEFDKKNEIYIYWKVGKPLILKEKAIISDTAIFKTNAPFIIETKDNRPVVFSDENFQTELNNVMKSTFKELYGRGLKQPLEFYPIKMKKEVIKHTLRGFREKTGKPIMYLTGNSGIFKLKGHPEDLQTIYQIGLGNRRSQGFGMVDIIGG